MDKLNLGRASNGSLICSLLCGLLGALLVGCGGSAGAVQGDPQPEEPVGDQFIVEDFLGVANLDGFGPPSGPRPGCAPTST